MRFRLKCFFGHLMISLMVALCCLCLVFLVWHPAPLYQAVGVGKIVMIMLAVDVILGPLLTLVIAKEGKKNLKWDLMIIGIIQVLALVYGMSSVAKGRPVWLAFYHNQFELVQAHTIQNEPNTLAQYANPTWLSPKWVAVRPTQSQQEQDDWLFLELEQGISPTMRPSLYQPIEEATASINQKKSPLSELYRYNDKAVTETLLKKYPQATGFLPLRAPEEPMTVLVDRQGQVIEIVNLHPWGS